jgi:hypothetical protein
MAIGRRQRRARSPWPRGTPRSYPWSSSPRAPSPNARTRTDSAEDGPTLPAETDVSAARPVRFRPVLTAPSTTQTPTPMGRRCDDDITRGRRMVFPRAAILSSVIVFPLSRGAAVPWTGSDPRTSSWNAHASKPSTLTATLSIEQLFEVENRDPPRRARGTRRRRSGKRRPRRRAGPPRAPGQPHRS